MTATWFGVRRDRAAAALAIGASASFLLCGYEFLRSVSQSLYIGAYTADRLPVVMALGPVGTLLFIWGYARLLSAAGARRAILLTAAGSALALVACFAAIQAGSRVATGVLYVFREAYIVVLIEQVWSFINSSVRREEGARLNGPVCGIASIGAIAGGLLVKALAVAVGSANLLLLAAATLVPTALLAIVAYEIAGEPQPTAEEAGGRRGHLGAGLLIRSRTLRDLALIVAATQVVSTLVDLQFSRYVEQAFPAKDLRTQWLGGFYAQLNTAAAAFQFVAAPLLLRWVPLRAIHLAIPAVHLAACAASIVRPSLAAAGTAYMAFKVLDYSLFRAAKELLYVPLSYDARYRAKELVDAFTYRFAKGAASLGLALATRVAAVPTAALPAAALAVIVAWFPLAWQITARPAASPTPGSPAGDGRRVSREQTP